MSLQDITTIACPSCNGATIVRNIQEHQHTNGHWYELREFACGFTLLFSPNDMTVKVTRQCAASDFHNKVIQKRELAYSDALHYVKTMDNVDDNFRSLLVSAIAECRRWIR